MTTETLLTTETPAETPAEITNETVEAETTNKASTTEETSKVTEVEIPETFLNEDGTPNYEKLTKSYNELRKKMSSKIAPDSINEYTYEFQEEGTFDEEGFKEFKELSMELGLSTDQFNKLMTMYENRMNSVINAFNPNVKEVLTEVWGDEFEANVQDAQRAFNTLPDTFDSELLGTNPQAMEILAYFGKQMAEDNSSGMVSSGGSLTSEQVLEMMKSPAYKNAESDVYKTVTAWFEAGNELQI